MAEFYIDDEKFASIPDRFDAIGLWMMAASWCVENGTGGWVPMSLLIQWGVNPIIGDHLVDAGLWAPISGDEEGYIFVGTWVRD